MEMIQAIVLALLLVVATVTIHYEILRGTSLLIPHLSIPLRSRILVVIAGVFVAHILAIFSYAAVYYLMQEYFSLGFIDGEVNGGPLDFFYFSATCYTTLGVGDVFPKGPLRVVASIEALNGFVLIGWSASFTYLSMQNFWEQHER